MWETTCCIKGTIIRGPMILDMAEGIQLFYFPYFQIYAFYAYIYAYQENA